METNDKGDILYITLTDINGNSILRDERNDSTLQSKLFTSHHYDDVTGLTYAHARYLDTRSHSFMSVDPIAYTDYSSVYYLQNPQVQNSYGYANNNPVSNLDKDGKSAGDALLGATNAWTSNQVFGVGRVDSDSYSGDKNDYEIGQNIGDIGSIISGSFEMFAGSSIDIGSGFVLAGTGGLAAPIAVPAAIGGAAIATHGASSVAIGAYNFSKNGKTTVSDNFTKGQDFENKVLNTLGESKNTKTINNGNGNRIPDILNLKKGNIGEIKNTNKLYLSPQLKTFINEAKNSSLKFYLYVNQNTKISKPLQSAISSMKGVVNRINP